MELVRHTLTRNEILMLQRTLQVALDALLKTKEAPEGAKEQLQRFTAHFKTAQRCSFTYIQL